MKKITTLIGLLILTAFVAQPIFAHMTGEKDGKSSRHAGTKCWESSRETCREDSFERRTAHLTQEQRDQLRELRDAHQKLTDPIKDQLADKRTELRDALSAQEPDEARVRQLSTEISTLKTELDQTRTEHLLQVKKLVPDAEIGKAHRDRFSRNVEKGSPETRQKKCMDWNRGI
ncbi:MAG TPA: periplasmic heavy metal sensor [Deltaproteobacteria bacterium]|nr:periplasmic heavy metal sensor [Deltaproteobacteria bacterium]